MAQQIINVGTAANDGTGDTLRGSQQKANANFTELYDGVLWNSISDYTDATLPVSGTEKFILNDGSAWKKITFDNIKAQLKIYFDTIYQAILVSGINIKTINGSSILGSGDLIVGGSSSKSFYTHFGGVFSLSTQWYTSIRPSMHSSLVVFVAKVSLTKTCVFVLFLSETSI